MLRDTGNIPIEKDRLLCNIAFILFKPCATDKLVNRCHLTNKILRKFLRINFLLIASCIELPLQSVL